jgi:hypothetical protein
VNASVCKIRTFKLSTLLLFLIVIFDLVLHYIDGPVKTAVAGHVAGVG